MNNNQVYISTVRSSFAMGAYTFNQGYIELYQGGDVTDPILLKCSTAELIWDYEEKHE